ncbi:MAG: DUF3488 domain-containing protein, partial [Deltaproteobacteria bacterium]|nr:DUF3488 domain-containing protein [Deltaproteobacteria bacterium]
MKFSDYTLAALYLMAIIGLWSVSLVPAVPPLFAAAFAPAVALSLILNIRKKGIISSRLWSGLSIGVVIFFTADYFALSGSLVGSASRALTILLALKLFGIKTGRDYITVYAIVFFQILSAAASTVSPVFFLILALFTMDVIFAMTIFNIKKDMLSASPSGAEPPPGLLDAPFFVSIIAVSAASIIITFALFFIMPRMGVGFFERKTADTVKVSGFSERVELGALGRVLLDPTVVMRVEVAGKDLQGLRRPLHLRGTALDTYDGASWSRKIKGLRVLKSDPAGLFHTAPPNPGAGLLQQNILLEPLDTDVIFAASRPVAAAGRFPVLKTDESGAVFLESTPYSRIQYMAWSDMT